jgi:signal transduction histidine kinase
VDFRRVGGGGRYRPAVGRAPFSRLSVKLSAILLMAVAIALGIVYVAVVPRLESQLVDAKLEELERAAPALAVQLPLRSPLRLADRVNLAARQTNARVVVLQPLTDERLTVFEDSSPVEEALGTDAVALEAAANGEVASGRVNRDGQELAEVAAPIAGNPGWVVLLSARLDDALHSVALVKRSLLIAGGIALGISWALGLLAALRLTTRVRRLEAAADRIAGGDFDEPVVDTGDDEIADLARSFDRMRVRLAQLDGARREFIANASHELRTPLFALGGFLELLADEDLDDPTRRDFLETARTQVERLTRLASDLLDLSRLDAGQLGLATEPVDLGATAEALAEEFGPLADSTGHVLRASTASGEAVGEGDAERVLRIGRSLVENALRHTPRGTTVELHAAVWVDQARLSVHDDGPGIPPAEQERVFERFYRGERVASEGSGIGLSIARELAQRMGGTIELRSEPGSTTFTLVLKRAPAASRFHVETPPRTAVP